MRILHRMARAPHALIVARLTGVAAAMLLFAFHPAAAADDPCTFSCGDLNGDGVIDFSDAGLLLDCMDQPPDVPGCTCADLTGGPGIDMRDVAVFAVLLGRSSDELPPDCSGASAAEANLTVYRPQRGSGYAPFQRTAVSEADEVHPTRGPGIRLNRPGDVDPAGEDDLIETQLDVAPAGARLALRRTDAALRVWLSRARQPGSEIAFNGDKSGVLPIDPAQTRLTLWVEWAGTNHGLAALHVEPPAVTAPKDTLVFHSFRSIVIALGGEGQAPSDPPDPTMGTFVAARALYREGYDVQMYDEDGVGADGAGIVYNEVATAIRDRGVETVAIFGYSHGGGSTFDLADRLDLNRAGLGVFEVQFTSYVDAVSNNSDFDTAQELRRPPSAAVHLNQYQHGVFFEDLGLDGGPVPNSVPPPTGLDVETTPWGANSTHFEVDDFVQVLDLLETSLKSAIALP